MQDLAGRIHRIELPVPFPIRTANAYLIDEEPLTLVDTGVKTDQSFSVLVESLARLGRNVGDIRRILITHGHIDHYGQAKRIASLSGAEIYMHSKAYERIRSMGRFQRNLVSVLHQNGTPKESLDEAIGYMKSAVEALSDPPDKVCFIDDNGKIPFDKMTLKSIHCPGHSPGLVCFYMERGGALFCGDHLLNDISPNPIIDLSRKDGGPQSTSLADYLRSVWKIADLRVTLVLPGHGEPFEDFRGAVEKAVRHHEERLSKVLSILSEGEKTAYEISKNLFPNTRSFDVFLGVSEILGHLRILFDQGRVLSRSRQGIDYYRAVRDRDLPLGEKPVME
ncbi:MAG: MBL fold metallo-hydrolase [Deltaproteobacteria bacterium]|nr:MBL fold metallo-hydrolase [Deltaproteobacteria bacterium]